MPSAKRDDVFIKFKNESVKIIVATIAFGMGIDKGNIRFVLHTSMPKTLENYSQEIGRAGRDGLNADVLLLYSKADEIGKKRFIDDLPDSSYKQSNYKKLESMYRFCISSKCRHQLIANYFEDDIEACEEICDNCLDGDKEYTDVTLHSQKFLSAVVRCEERFGQTYIIDVLRGAKIKRILDFGHDSLSVYGIGKDLSKEQWSSIADNLLDLEAITINGEYRTLNITRIAKNILQKKQDVIIDSASLDIKKSYSEYKQDIVVNEHYEQFRSLRTEISKNEEIAPYLVFGDKTLQEIASKLPKTKEDFLSISGIGELKYDKYFDVFSELINQVSIEPVEE
jgi:ATP-dependent DNA helicase RecQ